MEGALVIAYITFRLGLLYVLPVLVVGTAVQALLPSSQILNTVLLAGLELIGAMLLIYLAYRKDRTGLEILGLPPMIFAILIGNVLAIPAARKLRTVFGF